MDSGHRKARRLLSIPATQDKLGGIGRTKLWSLVRSGELVALKQGSRTFFEEGELDAYIDGLRARTPQLRQRASEAAFGEPCQPILDRTQDVRCEHPDRASPPFPAPAFPPLSNGGGQRMPSSKAQRAITRPTSAKKQSK